MKTTTFTNETFGARLERLRKQKKFTAKQVAVAVSVPESTYRDWEKNKGLRLPPFEVLSEVLAISVTELISGQVPDLAEHLAELQEIEARLSKIRLKLGSRI